jgi:ABC-2 type transport system permease protein
VRNVWALAVKELRGYFASPIAYVIMGFFALLFGIFFYAYLSEFMRQSMQMMGFGGGMNVNMNLVRPLFGNASVVLLFVIPMITMRTYSEEKRSGTIELLLTSPITDVQIIMGKFLGAMGLYLAMLAVTLLYIVIIFWFGNPDWRPIAAGYLGLLLMGGSFIALGLLISNLTKNQIVAGIATFGVFLMLWIISWIGEASGPRVQAVLSYLSITDHFDDFAKGVIDTKHLVYYLSFITFGLFLTAKSVDSDRWRG